MENSDSDRRVIKFVAHPLQNHLQNPRKIWANKFVNDRINSDTRDRDLKLGKIWKYWLGN